ncbi:LysR family transcriptional regulator [Undibacterium sp. LX40W]|uniref:LysR family transcriptional regulator n=1 Tax=Undibacterium nitidum TaxID=2762298 RepID=A0A923HL89_9BURK|nr:MULTISPECIES: LysR family transcriptional regulator [Undibacterium]MBC3879861.1 LysR family transcriptional regulator [Undibacterium nitidum]MBC3891403.1 LysR family transcriptional regulator [Undibacterium sp. LX40W]
MHFTVRQMNVLLAVAEHGNLTAAAKACHVTQPTVSMQLKSMAEQVGLPLYEVIGKQVFLTSAGEAVAKSARVMRDELQFLEQSINAMKGHTQGSLRVALVSTAKYFVPRMLGSFFKKYPEIDISFEVLNRDGVVSRLKENADDLYIMSMPPVDLELECFAFMENPLSVIAPRKHRLAQRKSITLTDLKDEQFILRESGSGTRLACNAYFATKHFEPKVRLELGSNEAIKQAVAGGLGISVLSEHALVGRGVKEGLVVLPIREFPIHSNWWIIFPKGKRLSPIAQVFLQHLKKNVSA